MIAWSIYLGSNWLDCVYFNDDCDRDYVYRSLVDHDGFSPEIDLIPLRKI
jgi:hypothetical protein